MSWSIILLIVDRPGKKDCSSPACYIKLCQYCNITLNIFNKMLTSPIVRLKSMQSYNFLSLLVSNTEPVPLHLRPTLTVFKYIIHSWSCMTQVTTNIAVNDRNKTLFSHFIHGNYTLNTSSPPHKLWTDKRIICIEERKDGLQLINFWCIEIWPEPTQNMN